MICMHEDLPWQKSVYSKFIEYLSFGLQIQFTWILIKILLKNFNIGFAKTCFSGKKVA